MRDESRRITDGPIYAGLVLAGGRSRRFGSDKALAVVRGKPLLERAMQAVVPCVDKIAVSIGDAEHPRHAAVRKWVHDIHAPAVCLTDARRDAGPLAGREAALEWAASSPLLVRAVDLPFVSEQVCRHLLRAWEARPPGTEIVLAKGDDPRPQPLASVWSADVLPSLRAWLDDGQRSVLGFLEGRACQTVVLSNEELKNVNSRADLT